MSHSRRSPLPMCRRTMPRWCSCVVIPHHTPTQSMPRCVYRVRYVWRTHTRIRPVCRSVSHCIAYARQFICPVGICVAYASPYASSYASSYAPSHTVASLLIGEHLFAPVALSPVGDFAMPYGWLTGVPHTPPPPLLSPVGGGM